nr:tRNA (adenosine(37)-N6)-dimethylallyltransferase MiaA [Oricola cellulosilytica]
MQRDKKDRRAVLIAGPTASGKSALALAIAARSGGVIVNADSMQVYEVLRILTARPGPEDIEKAPHRLYGHVDPATPYSTGRWLEDLQGVIDDPAIDGRPLIFTGGTGLYFRALEQGLSPMPAIPVEIRERWRTRMADDGPEALHEILRARDAAAAAAIPPPDGQRIVRALEVLEASGMSITTLQAQAGKGLIRSWKVARYLVMPDRKDVYANIEKRLDAMVDQGVLEEVAALRARQLDPALPAMKAIGVREFSAVLEGRMTMDVAIGQAKTATRRYAKRQITWFRNQLGEDWRKVGSEFAEKDFI